MEETDLNFAIKTNIEEEVLLIFARGNYSLVKANNLFKFSIDEGLLHNKRKIFIDVTKISGTIPFIDRYQFSEFLAKYNIEKALTQDNKIAVVGLEPLVHKDKFGETVAVNRGANARVFTDMSEASAWLHEK